MSDSRPALVSVICLCYNQASFVREALQSVLDQTYIHWELIVIDDASTDNSVAVIEEFLQTHPVATKFIPIPVNVGNCRAFNQGLALARGEYIVDLAADDVMLPERLSRQVATFEAMGKQYGVVYTNARRIDEAGKELGLFYDTEQSRASLPNGDVYAEVLRRSFICPPTMLIRKKVLVELGGYDEGLNYEDFDFWVRSSRNYRYAYLDEVLTARREVSTSHSRKFYVQKGFFTIRIWERAASLNRTPAEWSAWAQGVQYHTRQAFFTESFELVARYAKLLSKYNRLNAETRMLVAAARLKIRVSGLYKYYLKKRYDLEI